MSVEKNGRFSRRAQPFRVDQRIALAFNQLRGGHPGRPQLVHGELGGSPDIGLVFGKRTDAGDAEEGLQPFQKLGAVLLAISHRFICICITPLSVLLPKLVSPDTYPTRFVDLQ